MMVYGIYLSYVEGTCAQRSLKIEKKQLAPSPLSLRQNSTL
jgi:hypothetical protein